VKVQPDEPGPVVRLRSGWNLVVIDASEHNGPILDVFGPAVDPVGWEWLDGVLRRTDRIELRNPMRVTLWLKAVAAVDVELQSE